MNPDEVKDALEAVISHLIKDDPEAARAGLHDVLAAKMRERVSPTPEVTPDPTDPDNSDPEDPTDPDPDNSDPDPNATE